MSSNKNKAANLQIPPVVSFKKRNENLITKNLNKGNFLLNLSHLIFRYRRHRNKKTNFQL